MLEQLVKEQFKSKEKLIESNLHVLYLGRDWALMNRQCPIGLRLRRADAVGDRIFEGNARGAGRGLWWCHGVRNRSRPHPRSRTPSPATASDCGWIPRRSRTSRHRAGRGRTCLDRHGDRRGLERAALHRHVRPRHPADGRNSSGLPISLKFRPWCSTCSGPGPSTGTPTTSMRPTRSRAPMPRTGIPSMCCCSRRSGRGLRFRHAFLDLADRLQTPDLRHARSRHRHEPSPVPRPEVETTAAKTTAAR